MLNQFLTLLSDFSEFDDSDADQSYFPDKGSSYGDSEDSDDVTSVTLKDTDRPIAESNENIGRKRVRKGELHKKQVSKKLRNSGKAYIGHRNQPKSAKNFSYYVHECRYKCTTKIPEVDARRIFDSFWGLGTWDLQTGFISSCIKIETPLRKKTNAIYHKTKSVTINLKNQKVCKDFFLKTLSISNGRYSRVVNKKTDLGFIALDGRGKAPNPNRISDEDRNFVRHHINKFPKYTSHYCRKDNPNKKYLPSHLTVRKMYQCYLECCVEEEKRPVKEWLYREIFNTDFNLSFHQPHTDTCNKCDNFEILLKSGNEEQISKVKIDKELHQRKAEKGHEEKRQAKKLAQESAGEIMAICFDLQKTLPTPCLTTNKVYYLRTLWTYNFAIHDLGNNKAYMYTWDESIASRGSSEVASCLLKFIQQLPKSTKNIIAFSDSCGGQNKNKNILKFWMYVVQNFNIQSVDHKFLEPGHTYMECDEDFALIEKHKRHVQYIYVPIEWNKAIQESSKKFSVTQMTSTDFFSFSELAGIAPIIRNDKERRKIAWRQIRWIRVQKNQPYIMKFKDTLNDSIDFYEADWSLKCKGRPAAQKISLLYDEAPKIKLLKWQNLQELLQFVPPIYHTFYNTLSHEDSKVQKKSRNKKATEKGSTEATESLEQENCGDEEIGDDGDRIILESDED